MLVDAEGQLRWASASDQTAFERLRGAARSSTRRLADVAKDVTAGQPLPSSGRDLARARAEQARERQNGSECGN